MNRIPVVLVVTIWLSCWNVPPMSPAATAGEQDQSNVISVAIPSLRTDNHAINEAFRIAIGDLMGNVQPFKDGLLERPMPVILAGLHYDTPWTRDAAINAWNGGSLIPAKLSPCLPTSTSRRPAFPVRGPTSAATKGRTGRRSGGMSGRCGRRSKASGLRPLHERAKPTSLRAAASVVAFSTSNRVETGFWISARI
jgi:hypothetical protein